MTVDKAAERFRTFHKKEPDRIVTLQTKIPRIVVPIGYSPQISYHSNKWHKDNRWESYIHWWENPTLVCVPEDECDEPFLNKRFDLGSNRDEVTFLGYAIDFYTTPDDRSHIKMNPSTAEYVRRRNPEDQEENEYARSEGAEVYNFDQDPKRSQDYVVCSPNGRIVYVISDSEKELYAFINNKCRVEAHGIIG